MSYRIAVLDLGTNTFNLLLAQMNSTSYNIFYNDKTSVKIGQGGINNGIITSEAEERALAALKKYKKVIATKNIDHIYCYGTSAFRNAVNGIALKNKIYDETGFDVNIISGDLEAKYIYLGVKSALDIGEVPALIIDIGGGSVEFIIGNQSEIFWKKSFEIGAQRLLDQFHHIDPIPDFEIENLEQYFEETLQELFIEIKKRQIKTLIGSSGSFDTLSEIYCSEQNIPFDHDAPEFPLDIIEYFNIHKELIIKNREERLQIPGMIEMRVDMIVVASCLIDFILKKFEIEKIRVSSHSLKEGILDIIRRDLFKKHKITSNKNF